MDEQPSFEEVLAFLDLLIEEGKGEEELELDEEAEPDVQSLHWRFPRTVNLAELE